MGNIGSLGKRAANGGATSQRLVQVVTLGMANGGALGARCVFGNGAAIRVRHHNALGKQGGLLLTQPAAQLSRVVQQCQRHGGCHVAEHVGALGQLVFDIVRHILCQRALLGGQNGGGLGRGRRFEKADPDPCDDQQQNKARPHVARAGGDRKNTANGEACYGHARYHNRSSGAFTSSIAGRFASIYSAYFGI